MKICHDIFGCLHQQNRDTKPNTDSCEQFVCNIIIFDLHNYVMMEVGPLGSFPCLSFSIYMLDLLYLKFLLGFENVNTYDAFWFPLRCMDFMGNTLSIIPVQLLECTSIVI